MTKHDANLMDKQKEYNAVKIEKAQRQAIYSGHTEERDLKALPRQCSFGSPRKSKTQLSKTPF